eukprot:TRINITY_DN11222_c0_g1_i1.p1 TRINITY_DN11222_c0_g1~~TRINITY_DN11222_c0_g1_i1.p1  ORF type:complete len:144 (-),score=13.86 TRINITY_DN11222_c0_g1_i1:22-453(-)
MTNGWWELLEQYHLYLLFGLYVLYKFVESRRPFPEVPGVDPISNMEQWKKVLSENQVVLADFYAVWCGPCRSAAPLVGNLASQYEGRCKVVKVDVDKASDVSASNSIKAMPTFKLFKNGRQVAEVVGWKETKLREEIDKVLCT